MPYFGRLELRGGNYGEWWDLVDRCLANGFHRKRFENDEVEEERYFVCGKECGTRKRWWPDGKLRSRQGMQNGVSHGESEHWHFNGQLARKGHFENGEFMGVYRTWSEQGVLTWERHWRNGDQHGAETGWDKMGNFLYLIQYFEGTQIFEYYGVNPDDPTDVIGPV